MVQIRLLALAAILGLDDDHILDSALELLLDLGLRFYVLNQLVVLVYELHQILEFLLLTFFLLLLLLPLELIDFCFGSHFKLFLESGVIWLDVVVRLGEEGVHLLGRSVV